MEVVILLGAPGSGKGTVCSRVAEVAGYRHLSTGDRLREAIKAGTLVGRDAKPYIERGDLVPDDVMIRIVAEAMADEPSGRRRFILDGFPRTEAQARLLDERLRSDGGRLLAVILLEAPRDVLISRLAGRRVCRDCGATYHVVNIPPKREGQCDVCDGDLMQRPDDNEATVRNRLDVYESQTAPLIAYYERESELQRVDSARPLDVMVSEIRDLIFAGDP